MSKSFRKMPAFTTDHEKAMTIKGAKLFEPSPGRPMKEYVDFPRAVVDDPTALASWFEKAAAYACTLPPKKKCKATASIQTRRG